jgi:hypothetical protein
VLRQSTRDVFVALAAFLLSVSLVYAQTKDDKPVAQSPAAAPQKTKKERKRIEVSPVKTEDLLRTVTKEQARKSDGSAKKGEESPGVPEVTEFRRAADENHATRDSVTIKEGKKSPVRDVHGSLYGATGAANSGSHAVGGEVGASTKNKKTHIYVETERSRDNPPH